ncbi:hypothetical protein D3C75_873930 [compost metagenome]
MPRRPLRHRCRLPKLRPRSRTSPTASSSSCSIRSMRSRHKLRPTSRCRARPSAVKVTKSATPSSSRCSTSCTAKASSAPRLPRSRLPARRKRPATKLPTPNSNRCWTSCMARAPSRPMPCPLPRHRRLPQPTPVQPATKSASTSSRRCWTSCTARASSVATLPPSKPRLRPRCKRRSRPRPTASPWPSQPQLLRRHRHLPANLPQHPAPRRRLPRSMAPAKRKPPCGSIPRDWTRS